MNMSQYSCTTIQSYLYSRTNTVVPMYLPYSGCGMWNRRYRRQSSAYLSICLPDVTALPAASRVIDHGRPNGGGNTPACQRGEVTRELHAYPCRTIGLCLSTQSRLRHGRLLVAVVYDGPRNRNCPRDSLHRVCETDDVPMFLSPECRKIYSFTKRPLH